MMMVMMMIKKKSNNCHDTHVRVARHNRNAPVRTGSRKKKNKTSIKYMRGPWRGGNLPLLKRNIGGLLVNPLTFPYRQVSEKKNTAETHKICICIPHIPGFSA